MKILIPSLLALAVLPASLSAQSTLRFNGSSTTAKMVQPHAAAVGTAHQVEIVFVPNGTGHGVEDLAAGKAEVAMVTGTIEYFAKLINEKTPGTLDVAKVKTFRLTDLPTTAATVIVHPGVPVKSLTRDQIRDLFAGLIRNWKALGGPDLAVTPVMPDAFDGVGAALTVLIMQGVPFAPTTQRVGKATELAPFVLKTPGAMAFCSIANATGEVGKVATVPQFIPPNYLVTLGEPAEPLKSVITDFQARVK